MKIVKISSKGQITLARSLLTALDLSLHDCVLMEQEDEKIVLRPVKTSVAEELAGSLNKHINPSKLGVSFETIMKETKKKVGKHLAQKQ